MNIKCPYCKEEQEASFRLLYYPRQDCKYCDKTFRVSVQVLYEPFCLDKEHDMQQGPHDEKILICGNCDHFEEKGG